MRLRTAIIVVTFALAMLSADARQPSAGNVNTGANDRLARFKALETALGALAKPDHATQDQVKEVYGRLPLSFEANRGQTDARVNFLSRASGYSLFLTPGEAVLVLRTPQAATQKMLSHGRSPLSGERHLDSERTVGTVLRMKLVGANSVPQVAGLEELPGKSHCFLGNDPMQWRTNIPTCAKVEYQDVYPGVDLVYYGNQRQLEYDLVVAPGADPKVITLSFEGTDKVEIDAQGDLLLHTPGAEIRQHKPVVYQQVDGVRQEISGVYVLKSKHQVGFHVGAYDAARPLNRAR